MGEKILSRHGETTEVPPGAVDRSVWSTLESGRPIAHIAADLGVNSEVMRKRVRQTDADAGQRKDMLTTEEARSLCDRRRCGVCLREPGRIRPDPLASVELRDRDLLVAQP